MTEQQYQDLIQPYMDAVENLMVRFDTLNKDYQRNYQECPIHHIQSRIKARKSLSGKLSRRSLPDSVQAAKEEIMDIGGIRVICYFTQDVYNTVALLKKQTDLIIVKEVDYIKAPKPNGYRSFHVVFAVPIYHADGKEYYPVEVQFRTLSMDLWASMEHRICYKKQPEDKKAISQELLLYAQELGVIEDGFQQHR